MADMTAAMLNYQNPNAAPWWANGGFGGALGAWYTDPVTGQTYQPIVNDNGSNAEGGGGVMPTRTGYAAYDMSAPGEQRFEDGQTYDEYGADGKFIANRNFLSTKDDLGELLTYAALAAGGMQFLPGGMFGGPAGGAGAGAAGAGEAGAGFSGAAAGDAGLMYAGADAAAAGTLGSASIPTASLGTGAMGAGAAGLGAAGAGGGGSGGFLSGLFGGGGAAGGTGALGALGSALGGGGSNWLGLGATALGGLLGAKGNQASTSSTRAMDPRMDALFYGDLAPKTASAMAGQIPAANTAGNQMLSVGSGLLGRTEPGTATNPYATGILDDLQRRHQQMISQNLQGVKGNAVGVGGLGGSRQGVAEAQAITTGADNFTGQAANFMGGLYNRDQDRLRQDWTLGAGLQTQGLNTQLQPFRNASDIYSPFTGFGTTTQNQESGGGWGGALGGALGAAQFGKNMGWFGGNSSDTIGVPKNPYASGGWW